MATLVTILHGNSKKADLDTSCSSVSTCLAKGGIVGSMGETKTGEGLSGKYYLGGLLFGAVVLGGMDLAMEFSKNADERENAIVAEACADSYPGEDGLSQSAVDCMNEGWIPDAGSAEDTEAFVQGAPVGLVEGYVDAQRAASRDIDEGSVATWALLGAAGVTYLVYKIDPAS